MFHRGVSFNCLMLFCQQVVQMTTLFIIIIIIKKRNYEKHKRYSRFPACPKMDLVRVCQLESPRMLTLCCHYNVVTYSANASCASHGEVYSLHTASCLRGLNWYHMWLQLFQLFVLFTDIILSIISSPSAEVCHLNGLCCRDSRLMITLLTEHNGCCFDLKMQDTRLFYFEG